MVTGIVEVTQDPEKAGSSLKVLSLRLRGMKGQLQELGEETDENVENISKMQGQILNMTKGKVNIFDASGNFKSTYEIMQGIASVWDELSSIDQADLLETIAGKNRANDVAALLSNWENVEAAVKAASEAEGSAARENAKYVDSLQGRLDKLKTSWQSFATTFMNTDLVKGGVSALTGFVEILEGIIDKIGVLGTLGFGASAWGIFSQISSTSKAVGGLKSIADIIPTLNLAFPNVANAAKGFFGALKGGQGIIAALGAGFKGLWGIIAAHPIAAIVAAVGLAVAAFANWHESAGELKERIEDVTTSYREQHDSLMKLKGDFDTSNEDSMVSRYGELSKGVNALGENVALTADEYSEYQSIVDTIANQFPSLVTGYNSQGDAILSCAGNVDVLTESYKNLIREQNKEVLDTGEDIFKDFENDLKKTSAYYKTQAKKDNGGISAAKIEHFDTKHFDELEKLMNLNDDGLESAIAKLTQTEVERISGLLDEYGIERNVLFDGEAGWENQREHIIRALNKDKAEIKSILDEAAADLNAYAEDLSTVTDAYFSDKFLGDYAHMSERMQNIITQVTSGFDSEFYAQFLNDENPYESLTKYFDDMLNTFNSLGSGEAKKLEAAFDLQTRFNGGEISYGEYVNGIKEAEELVAGLGLDDEVESQIKLALNTEEVTKNYEALKKRLADKYKNETLESVGSSIGEVELEIVTKEAEEKAENFLNGLSASEYQVAVDLIANGEIDLNDFDVDSLRDYIEKQAKLNEAMNFTIAMDVETESFEALNTAMAESVSGAGLSSDAIAALKGRYAELASQGYDLSAMFEETANGIHLNRSAVSEFEQALAAGKISEADDNLKVLKARYDELTDEINNCTDAGERANLYSEQQDIARKINELATLTTQLEGLTSAYNAWQSVESSGSERDMYESIIEGFENIGDEISRGWYDDGTIKFLELMTGETDLATKSATELKEVWNSLDDTIKGTSYSVKDFFTVDEDGNSTSTGAYNFLRAVEELKKNGTLKALKGKDINDLIVRNDKDKIVGFDFNVVGGDEAIADALGVSEEMVQIIQRALDDAGFTITLDGKWTLLADLKTSAETANNTLKKLKSEGLENLKNISEEDLNFNFDASSLTALNDEFAKATKVLDQFKDKNGQLKKDAKGNLVEGAQEALDIATYYQATIDKLTEPTYMQLETNQVEENLQKPLAKMQEFEDLVKTKHMLTLEGDTEGLKETEQKMTDIAEWLKNLNKDTKVDLDIDGLSTEEIKDKLEKGEIEIPATVDIQLEMSEDIKDMRLLMMRELGLVSENEVKLKIGYEIDDSTVDRLDDKEQEVVVKFITENEEWFDKLSDEKREIAVELVASGVDLDNLDDEKKEIVLEFVTENEEELDNLTDEERQILIKAVAEGTDDVDGLNSIIEKLPEDVQSNVRALVGDAVSNIEEVDDKLKNLDRDSSIEVIANVFGVEDVEGLSSKLKNLDDKTIQAIAEVLGQTNVESLKIALSGMSDVQVQAIAEAIGKGDVDALKNAIGGLDSNTVQAIAQAFGYDDVNQLNTAIENLDPKTVQAIAQALGLNDVNTLKTSVNNMKGKKVDAEVNTDGQAGKIKTLQSSIFGLKGTTVDVVVNFIKSGYNAVKNWLTGGGDEGGSGVNGTANVNGTTGRAFKQGNWGTKNSGTALVGELGREVLIRGGRYFTVGDYGAEFIKYQKGDIILNHVQSEELFKNGRVTSGGGRAKALVNGTAFVQGTAFSSGSGGGEEPTTIVVGTNKNTGTSYTKSTGDSAKDFEETFDWIEIAIDRVERAIDQLDTKANSVYRSWSERNSNLTSEISKVSSEIDLQQRAYQEYMNAAAGVGLSSSYAAKVRNGTIDISTVKDEALADKIKDYQNWYLIMPIYLAINI